jgi:8-oxo-dGTP pyrophosphatase MutT (NUDIX family)
MMGMENTELPVRLAGRVIVLDPRGRVLLFRYDDPAPNGRHWATPGGGLEADEDYYAGAVRELSEETGWDDVPVDRGAVLHRELTMRAGGPAGPIVRQHERFFVARVAQERRPLGEVAAMHVHDGICDARWWTVAELDSTGEAVWPDGLADLIRKVTSAWRAVSG